MMSPPHLPITNTKIKKMIRLASESFPKLLTGNVSVKMLVMRLNVTTNPQKNYHKDKSQKMKRVSACHYRVLDFHSWYGRAGWHGWQTYHHISISYIDNNWLVAFSNIWNTGTTFPVLATVFTRCFFSLFFSLSSYKSRW